MTTYIDSTSSTYLLFSSHESYVLDYGKTITTSGNSIFSSSAIQDTIVEIYGNVASQKNGILLLGTDMAVYVYEWNSSDHSGEVAGTTAILMSGAHSAIYNLGHILGKGAGSQGIAMTGPSSEIVNGTYGDVSTVAAIRADYAVTFQSGIFENFGDVHAKFVGVRLGSIPGLSGNCTVENNGTISAQTAIEGSSGRDIIYNMEDAHIYGNINLNAGNDIIFLKGEVKGHISGRTGDDLYIIERPDYFKIIEEEIGGNDTVKTMFSYKVDGDMEIENIVLTGIYDTKASGNEIGNKIYGNSGSNYLAGYGGNDYLSGGPGADQLVGGADQDHFLITKGSGADVVTDFQIYTDHIDLTELDLAGDFKTLIAQKILKIESDGDYGTLISVGKDSLDLIDIHPNTIREQDIDL